MACLAALRCTDGPPNTPGEWTTVVPPACIDNGQAFAGKDMWDPVGKRRIYWACECGRLCVQGLCFCLQSGLVRSLRSWHAGAHDVLPASALTLAREVTWHGVLQQFNFAPLPEQVCEPPCVNE
jgi:hypothetical protein